MPKGERWSHRDVLAADSEAARLPVLDVEHGMTLTHTASNTVGTVAGFAEGDRVLLVDRWGTTQVFRAFDGAFTHEGRRVALRAPVVRDGGRTWTASGSVRDRHGRAGVAVPSRIWVEGHHDAELVEKVWGDDLRSVAVVVEPLHGAEDLAAAVAGFSPGPDRRLGVLLDHLVPGSKESRIAASVEHPWVLVTGHPFVDVWAAVDPAVIGIERWPDVPRGRPWKDGIMEVLGVTSDPGVFWKHVLEQVRSYRDLATPLVNAVEQLIDFVAEPTA
jgi:hypothetical protein